MFSLKQLLNDFSNFPLTLTTPQKFHLEKNFTACTSDIWQSLKYVCTSILPRPGVKSTYTLYTSAHYNQDIMVTLLICHFYQRVTHTQCVRCSFHASFDSVQLQQSLHRLGRITFNLKSKKS